MTNDYNDRQADPTGLIASLKAAGKKPFLGDNAVLDGLVRKLAGDVFERFDKFTKGELTSTQASDADKQACQELACVLLGQNADYAPVPGWTDYGLAAGIRREMSEAVHYGDDASVVAQACALFVHGLYRELAAITDDNERQVGASVNESIQSFVWLLLGIEKHDE